MWLGTGLSSGYMHITTHIVCPISHRAGGGGGGGETVEVWQDSWPFAAVGCLSTNVSCFFISES